MKWNLITTFAIAAAMPTFAGETRTEATNAPAKLQAQQSDPLRTQEQDLVQAQERDRTQTQAQLTERTRAREQVREALESRVEAPKTPPALPDAASERARYAHESLAFGKKGAEMRDANEQAGQRSRERARAAGENGRKGMDGAEAQRGNSDRTQAAGRARTEEARGAQGMNLPGGNGYGTGSGGAGSGSGSHPVR